MHSNGPQRVSAQNVAPVICAITWLLLAWTGLAVLLRLLTRHFIGRQWGLDDVLFAGAFVSYVLAAGHDGCFGTKPSNESSRC